MSENSWNEENIKEIKAALGPEYDQNSKKIKPLIWRVINPIDKKQTTIIQLKKNAVDYYKRFNTAILIGGMKSYLQNLQLKTEEPQLVSAIKLFQYLGLVESIGTTIVDMLVLLLVADGHLFHVERPHEVPRIVHAKNFEDLDSPNSTLGSKIAFLERNELEIISKLIDRKLRNSIAHLEFEIDKNGKITTKNCKDLRIDEKITRFRKLYMGFLLILLETGFIDFLGSCIKENEAGK